MQNKVQMDNTQNDTKKQWITPALTSNDIVAETLGTPNSNLNDQEDAWYRT